VEGEFSEAGAAADAETRLIFLATAICGVFEAEEARESPPTLAGGRRVLLFADAEELWPVSWAIATVAAGMRAAGNGVARTEAATSFTLSEAVFAAEFATWALWTKMYARYFTDAKTPEMATNATRKRSARGAGC